MVFVYFKKAFKYSIDHVMLWKILRRYGIPAAKIVRMFQVLYDGFQASILHERRMTKSFEMKTRVQQGSPLDPLLFLVTLDWLTRQVYSENKTRNLQFTMCKKLENLEFVDDLVLFSQRTAHVQIQVVSG